MAISVFGRAVQTFRKWHCADGRGPERGVWGGLVSSTKAEWGWCCGPNGVGVVAARDHAWDESCCWHGVRSLAKRADRTAFCVRWCSAERWSVVFLGVGFKHVLSLGISGQKRWNVEACCVRMCI